MVCFPCHKTFLGWLKDLKMSQQLEVACRIYRKSVTKITVLIITFYLPIWNKFTQEVMFSELQNHIMQFQSLLLTRKWFWFSTFDERFLIAKFANIREKCLLFYMYLQHMTKCSIYCRLSTHVLNTWKQINLAVMSVTDITPRVI